MDKRKSLFYAFPAFLIVVVTITTVSLTAAGGGDGLGVAKGLQFSGSSSFRIAIFADLHYGENAWDDWGPKQDVKSDRVQSSVLDNEKPGDTSMKTSLRKSRRVFGSSSSRQKTINLLVKRIFQSFK